MSAFECHDSVNAGHTNADESERAKNAGHPTVDEVNVGMAILMPSLSAKSWAICDYVIELIDPRMLIRPRVGAHGLGG
jgi:hypothetical protein